MTLLLTFFGLGMGFVIGLVLALVRVYGAEELGWLAIAYEKILRGIPVYILMFILAFGLGWNLFTGVAIALGIRSGAYQSQIIRGAILSVDPQQLNAARSIGMTQSQAARHIVIPEMFYAATRLYYGNPALFLLATVAMTIVYFLLTYPLTRTIGEAQAVKLRELGLGGG
jgi:polar amino acid transport system permease protein